MYQRFNQSIPFRIDELIKPFKRILKQTLCLWTNRVIEVKLREYEVAQRYDTIVKA
jgi:hypothetical protein